MNMNVPKIAREIVEKRKQEKEESKSSFISCYQKEDKQDDNENEDEDFYRAIEEVNLQNYLLNYIILFV